MSSGSLMTQHGVLNGFVSGLGEPGLVDQLREGLIGEGAKITTPFGSKRLTYADYTASGRALVQVENFIRDQVLPFYANSHTESSHCGATTTRAREQSRRSIALLTNCRESCSVIFTGSGATSAINRLVSLCGAAGVEPGVLAPVVFVGPYEHHSNILPWRESGAQVIEIGEAKAGGPDLQELEAALREYASRPLRIGAFSAASNVTGICTDVDAVTGLLRRHGARAFWDYAGGAPYLPIDMNPANGPPKDAVFLSPHKFPGGPGASGLLIMRRDAVTACRPTWPGGGSVAYVSPWAHDYLGSLVEREEAGTPNVIGDIRAALVMLIKSAIGTDFIAKRDRQLIGRAEQTWSANPSLQVLGAGHANRLPIFSFIVRRSDGTPVHHQLVARMLNDLHGIQTRAGCVCAGPYGHSLLNVSRQTSERIRRAIQDGREIEKPGWVRLNFSYLMDDATVERIIEGVDSLAHTIERFEGQYTGDATTAQFRHMDDQLDLVGDRRSAG